MGLSSVGNDGPGVNLVSPGPTLASIGNVKRDGVTFVLDNFHREPSLSAGRFASLILRALEARFATQPRSPMEIPREPYLKFLAMCGSRR
jgi:hypothetical protein